MELIVNNNLFNVKCVITTKDIQKGMMGKRFNGFDGMLFFMRLTDKRKVDVFSLFLRCIS